MTLRGFPPVLVRKKSRGYNRRRRSSELHASGTFDSVALLEEDASPVALTYPQFLDVLGRIAVTAFKRPPYRNRYDTTKARVHGFFVDYLGVTGQPTQAALDAQAASKQQTTALVISDWRSLVRMVCPHHITLTQRTLCGARAYACLCHFWNTF